MNCPNCGNEIKNNQKFCTHCGVKIIQDEIKQQEETNQIKKKYKKPIMILIIATFVVVILFTLMVFATNTATSVSTYKSITPLEQSQLDNMTSKEMLNLSIQQDEDMGEFVKRLHKGKADKLFEVFYKNLLSMVLKMNIDDLDTVPVGDMGEYKLNPATELFDFSVNDVSGIWLNNKYIQKKYSKYLGDIWQKYLKISANSLSNDLEIGYYADRKQITDEIISWQDFLTKNPNFVMNERIRKTVKFLTTNILYSDYAFTEGSLGKEYKAGYEYFLKKVNPKTEEYKIVKNCYYALKKNGFNPDTEYYTYLAKWDNYYEYLLNNNNYTDNTYQQE